MSLKFNNLDNVSLDDLEADSEFIPLMTSEDEEALEKEKLPEVLPILPLINTVLFPGVVIPINAGRDKSIKLIQDANKSNKLMLYSLLYIGRKPNLIPLVLISLPSLFLLSICSDNKRINSNFFN